MARTWIYDTDGNVVTAADVAGEPETVASAPVADEIVTAIWGAPLDTPAAPPC